MMHTIGEYYKKAEYVYGKTFHLEEVEKSKTLQLVSWALLLGWFVEFLAWSRFGDFTVNAVLEGKHLCWPFFQSCGDWYFLTQVPLGNSHGAIYAILFGLIIVAGYLLVRGSYKSAHMILFSLFLWEMAVLMMSMRLAVNYWYFHVFYAALFLFPVGKLVFLRIGAVLLYFFSGILKLDDSWISGSYFKALSEGLYFVPDRLIPLATNAVIFMEVILVWLLLSGKKSLRVPVVALLFIFHTYSVVYVGYTYPIIALPIVLILFLSKEEYKFSMHTIRHSFSGVGILFMFLAVHFIPYTISGNERITGEGNKYGMYMFGANYQCASSAGLIYADGRIEEQISNSFYAIQRCDPYAHYFFFKQKCGEFNGPESITWTFDTSINGSPLMRIVDVEDSCSLEYKPFSHNEWIRIPGKDDVEIVGFVLPNQYKP
jgi:hypothetical protein